MPPTQGAKGADANAQESSRAKLRRCRATALPGKEMCVYIYMYFHIYMNKLIEQRGEEKAKLMDQLLIWGRIRGKYFPVFKTVL